MEKNELIKKENVSFFQKIKNFLKKIFGESKKKEENVEKEKNVKNDFNEENRIFQLQLAYENGSIKEEVLNESDKNKLISLYNEQIKSLEDEIQIEEKIFEDYKIKILEQKNMLKNS